MKLSSVISLSLLVFVLSSYSFAQKTKISEGKSLRRVKAGTIYNNASIAIENQEKSKLINNPSDIFEDFPKWKDTGEYDKDKSDFLSRKKEWISDNPDKASVLVEKGMLDVSDIEFQKRPELGSNSNEIHVSEIPNYPILNRTNVSEETLKQYRILKEEWKKEFPEEYSKTIGKKIIE